jgi:hypothetical protein
MRLRSGKKINEPKEEADADNGVCTTFTYMVILFATLKGAHMMISHALYGSLV